MPGGEHPGGRAPELAELGFEKLPADLDQMVYSIKGFRGLGFIGV